MTLPRTPAYTLCLYWCMLSHARAHARTHVRTHARTHAHTHTYYIRNTGQNDILDNITVSAIGCADPPYSKHSWTSRTGNDLAIKCNESRETWHLTCDDGKWLGTFGNCSKNTAHRANIAYDTTAIPHGKYETNVTNKMA